MATKLNIMKYLAILFMSLFLLSCGSNDSIDVEEARKEHEIVFVDFYSEGCKPCKKLSPIIDSLSEVYPAVEFLKVDVNSEDGIHKKYDISFVPTVIIYRSGEEVVRLVGLQEVKVYRNYIDMVSGDEDSFGTVQKKINGEEACQL